MRVTLVLATCLEMTSATNIQATTPLMTTIVCPTSLTTLGAMLQNMTVATNKYRLLDLEKRVNFAVTTIHESCSNDLIRFCGAEITSTHKMLVATQEPLPHLHLEMARVTCLKEKYQQLSISCQLKLSTMDLELPTSEH